jgi:hypothetical protein
VWLIPFFILHCTAFLQQLSDRARLICTPICSPGTTLLHVFVLVAALQEAGSMSARQTPNSCRNNNTSIMLSSNGTPVYVKTDIIAQNASAVARGLVDSSSETLWAVKVTRSTKAALLAERRMQLLVASDGRILWASPMSPAALFGLEPSALVGQKLQTFIDLFAEYCSGKTPLQCVKWLRRPVACCSGSVGLRATACLLHSVYNQASLHLALHSPMHMLWHVVCRINDRLLSVVLRVQAWLLATLQQHWLRC